MPPDVLGSDVAGLPRYHNTVCVLMLHGLQLSRSAANSHSCSTPRRSCVRAMYAYLHACTLAHPWLRPHPRPCPLALAKLQRGIPRATEEGERDTDGIGAGDGEVEEGDGEKDGEDLFDVGWRG